jgi:hypothetical protein
LSRNAAAGRLVAGPHRRGRMPSRAEPPGRRRLRQAGDDRQARRWRFGLRRRDRVPQHARHVARRNGRHPRRDARPRPRRGLWRGGRVVPGNDRLRGVRARSVARRCGGLPQAGCRCRGRPVGRRPGLPPGKFDGVTMLGNNLGRLASPDEAPSHLRWLADRCVPGAILVGQGLDVRHTDDPNQLAYHVRARSEGRPIGQIRLRIRFADLNRCGLRLAHIWGLLSGGSSRGARAREELSLSAPQLGRGRVAVEPLAGDPMEVPSRV